LWWVRVELISSTESEFIMSTAAIVPTRTFGALAAATAASSSEDRPTAMAWLNIGYPVEFVNAKSGETETRFISIPVGIPLDTQKPINITSRNDIMQEMQAAQNELLKQLQDVAAGMEAGGEVMVDLQLQLRRINDKVEAPTITEASPFARKGSLLVEQEVPAKSK
jgi:hypothetical protein